MNVVDPSFRYTEEHHAQYDKHGYCIVGKLLSDEGLAACQLEVDTMIREKKRPDLPADSIISAHQQERWLFELATAPALLDMIERQIGPNIVFWSSHLVCKPPKSGTHVPWHQDTPYWNISGPLPGSTWIALDDIDAENGGMCLLPDWHRVGTLPRRSTGNNVFSEEIAPNALPPNVEDLKLQYQFPAGWMATHDTMLPHTSEPNASNRWRRVIVFRYMTPEGDMGPKVYNDYRTGEPFNREYYLVRGTDVAKRGLKPSPFA
jgi:ectoine hydroxylase-related dioxygenase (phytanoyl-CoA dioxygenase family)